MPMVPIQNGANPYYQSSYGYGNMNTQNYNNNQNAQCQPQESAKKKSFKEFVQVMGITAAIGALIFAYSKTGKSKVIPEKLKALKTDIFEKVKKTNATKKASEAKDGIFKKVKKGFSNIFHKKDKVKKGAQVIERVEGEILTPEEVKKLPLLK